MELMKSIADKHGLACLLHEKPFAGVNGSGKHNNWALSTDTGTNLLEPGDTPHENAQFILFLAAVIKAVDDYQDLLRVSVANAGNDHRLGANEAPPAIVSMFLGDELTDILNSLESEQEYKGTKRLNMELGASVLPHFPKDTTDRNRTSPFAFTGNKFEFRMLGSTFSISGPNIILNTIVAEILSQFADELEKEENFNASLTKLVRNTIKNHKRIIFNGNNYSDEWVQEAKQRGLLNLKTTKDALPKFIDSKNIELFKKHSVFTEGEVHARYEILSESYQKTIHIEALTLVEIVSKHVFGYSLNFQNELSDIAYKKKAIEQNIEFEQSLIKKVSDLTKNICSMLEELKASLVETKSLTDTYELASFYRESVFAKMTEIRLMVDELETLVPKKYWEMPTYSEILYSVN